ncbi:MAG: hypothetical protein EAX86_03860 [Candidatus Heimdallarchaeota archaeon]|nr:hypothetical protein [Candidatus Heimdallarchaeota archaeon]
MLEIFLRNQNIIVTPRIGLLSFPDYLFFRTHSQKLYREFLGIPRYSIIARKITDKVDEDEDADDLEVYSKSCTLKTLFVVDGSTALNNAPFYFPLSKQLDLSVVGTRLDFTEIPKLRYSIIKGSSVSKFDPIAIFSSDVHYHASLDESGFESKSVTLPPQFELYTQPIIPITKNTIAVGSVRSLIDFAPLKFDILRINLGDFVEYNQIFANRPKRESLEFNAYKTSIIKTVQHIIEIFQIPVVLITFYKLSKFFHSPGDNISILDKVKTLKENLHFREALVIKNERRRIWEQDSIRNLPDLFDTYGYLTLFNK